MARIVRQLAGASVQASSIGVICFYRAQVVAHLMPVTLLLSHLHFRRLPSYMGSACWLVLDASAAVRQACWTLRRLGSRPSLRLQVDAVQHQLNCGIAAGMLQAQEGSAGDDGAYFPQVATVDSFQARINAALSYFATATAANSTL